MSFRTSFLIKQINGFNKNALNSNKSILYNICKLGSGLDYVILLSELGWVLITNDYGGGRG